MLSTSSYCQHAVFFDASLQQLPLQVEGNVAVLHFDATPGLYQFTAVADGTGFDWESLYIDLELFGNRGQRTGPWDFDLTDGNRALMPSFWVELDGKRLGLWYFQRLSLADIEAKKFRGSMAFHLETGGRHELRFVSYQEQPLPWNLARLETDPQDRLLPEISQSFVASPPAARWAEDYFWEGKRRLLQCEQGLLFRRHWPEWFEASAPEARDDATLLPLLLAAWKLYGNRQALQALIELTGSLVEQPHWGNPRPDGYGHDGDMRAGVVLRNLTWVWRATAGATQFPAELHARLQGKLLLQSERYFALALLNRDYWGGSVLQDHGWRSLFMFGDAVLHLWEKCPQAGPWVRFALPRIGRALDAIPRDGAIPPSSYCNLLLYVEELAFYRETRLAYDGVDIYRETPLPRVPAYVHAVLRPAQNVLLTSMETVGGDVIPFSGGAKFLSQIAQAYGDTLAATLARLSLEQEPEGKPRVNSVALNTLGTLITMEAGHPVLGSPEPLPPASAFLFFEDSGLVHAHQHAKDVTFALRCGPLRGHHAERFCITPCDETICVPGAGHFILARGGKPLLTTPDFGYSLQSAMRSCLLIDGQGQNGDVGYPMSIPSQPPGGERLEMARCDEKAQTVEVRLNLARAYPAALGVVYYVRQFYFSPAYLLIRDEILLDSPRQLSWLFQGKRENGLAIEKDAAGVSFGQTEGIRLCANAPALEFHVSIRETPLVWSYHSPSGRKAFDYACFQTTGEVTHGHVEFRVEWDS